MAFHSRHLLRFLPRFERNRYQLSYLRSSFPLFPFSTSNSLKDVASLRQIDKQRDVDEHYVLKELSDLLKVSSGNSILNLYKESNPVDRIERRTVDDFLLPEERLRGVFLQKLRGRTAVEEALMNIKVEMNLDVVAKVVNRGNLGGEAMVMFFNWALRQPSIPKDIHTYNVIVKALGRRKFFSFMVGILHEMVEECMNPNLETLAIVMDSFIRARQVYKAVQIFENLEEFGLKSDAESLNVLLQCLCQRLHVGAANSFFNSMKGKVLFNVLTYNIIIGGWSRLARISEMEKVFKELINDGFIPDHLTFIYLIEGLGRSGRIDDSIEIFNAMKQRGFTLNASAYNAVISNYISAGDFDECMKYYRGMLSSKCDPNVDTYIRLISGFLKARKVADALELFEEMLGCGIVPSTGTITSFIEPLCHYGPPHAAMMIYKKARKANCKISLSAYKLLLMRLSKLGKCGMLLDLWYEMQESGYSPDVEVYGYVIRGLCDIGQLENAAFVMEECLRKGFCPSRLVYSKLSNKLLASDKLEGTYKLFLKIKAARRKANARRSWRAKGWHF